MPRPDAVRRVKSYSAADGYVYQYYFFEGNRAQREGSPGGEFTYVITADRRSAFPFKIFVKQSALDAWAKQNGRPLTSSEEYAVAKMRLFRASMKVPSKLAGGPASREVPSTNPTLKSCSDNWGSSREYLDHPKPPFSFEPILSWRRPVRCLSSVRYQRGGQIRTQKSITEFF